MISFNPHHAPAMKVGIAAAAAVGLYAQPYRPMVFVGRSMEPVYGNHSITWTEPVGEENLRRGQVVVINMDSGPIVKRIAFMGGDRIRQIRVGGQWVDMIQVHLGPHSKVRNQELRQTIVPTGMVYVLGDNMPVSSDSREFGYISANRIKRVLVDQRPPLIGTRMDLSQETAY